MMPSDQSSAGSQQQSQKANPTTPHRQQCGDCVWLDNLYQRDYKPPGWQQSNSNPAAAWDCPDRDLRGRAQICRDKDRRNSIREGLLQVLTSCSRVREKHQTRRNMASSDGSKRLRRVYQSSFRLGRVWSVQPGVNATSEGKHWDVVVVDVSSCALNISIGQSVPAWPEWLCYATGQASVRSDVQHELVLVWRIAAGPCLRVDAQMADALEMAKRLYIRQRMHYDIASGSACEWR